MAHHPRPAPPPLSKVDLAAIALIALALAALNAYWQALHQAPPVSDDNSHLSASLHMLDQAASIPSWPQSLSSVMLYPSAYPPLTYQVTLVAYGLLGVSPLTPVASFFPFLAILGLSMYGIGVNLGGRPLGWACALATLGAPVVLDHSRTYFIDLPATTMLALSVMALSRSRDFTDLRWSLLFGVSMALGVLTRWTHLLFVLPMLAYAVGRALHRARPTVALAVATVGGAVAVSLTWLIWHAPVTDGCFVAGPGFNWGTWAFCGADIVVLAWLARALARRRGGRESAAAALVNMVESLALFAFLAWPWYWYNGARVRSKLDYQQGVHVGFWQGVHAYLTDLSTMVYLGPVLLGIGVTYGLWRPRLRAVTVMLITSLALAIGFASLLPPDSRYFMPAIVFAVPLALFWTRHLPRGAASQGGLAVLALVIVVSIWQATAFVCHHQGFTALDGPTRRETFQAPTSLPIHLGLLPVLPEPPAGGIYPYDDLVEAVRARETARPVNMAVLITPDDAASFQPRTFLYRAALRALSLSVVQSDESIRAGKLREDVAPCSVIVVVYPTPDTQAQLLEMARANGWLDASARPWTSFLFSPTFHVDLYYRDVPAPAP